MDYAIKKKVADTLRRLHKEGKNIFGGYFDTHNGNVILTATLDGDKVNACYCYYDSMYNYQYEATEILQDGDTIKIF